MYIWSCLKKAAPIFLQYTMDTVICQDTLDISLLQWSVAEWKQTDILATQQSLSGYIISSSPKILPQFLSGTVNVVNVKKCSQTTAALILFGYKIQSWNS